MEKGIAPTAKKVVPKMAITKDRPNEISKLSEYPFFEGKIAELKPAKNVYEYKLNNALFSDYSYKKRFIYFPEGKKMSYRPEGVMKFDVGSIIIKNFYYPLDFRNPEGEKQIIETRLLIKEENQSWKTLSYVWNDEQTDAFVNIIGGETPVSWIDHKGKSQNLNYVIPNHTQCKSCHMLGREISPIGPIAGQLNRKNIYQGIVHDQLEYLLKKKFLRDYPTKIDVHALPCGIKKIQELLMKGPKPTFTSTALIVIMTLVRQKIQALTSPTTRKTTAGGEYSNHPLPPVKGREI